MFDIGFSEILVIAGLSLVVLGPDKLPGVARRLGNWAGRARAMARQFRDQLEAEADNLKVDLNVQDANTPNAQPAPPPSPPPPPPPAPSTDAGQARSGAAGAGVADLPPDDPAVEALKTSPEAMHAADAAAAPLPPPEFTGAPVDAPRDTPPPPHG